MRKQIIFFLLSLLVVSTIWARTTNKRKNIFEENDALISVNIDCDTVMLTTQDEVIAFGAMNFTEISGCLIINDLESKQTINDLSPLSMLISVSGVLSISTKELTNLDGLSSLTSVGYFNIINNQELQSLNGLSALVECTGPVVDPASTSVYHNHIRFNPSLVSISGLSNIEYMNSGLFIRNLDTLQNLNGLSGLSFIGGALSIETNPYLQNIDSLINLKVVERDLVIRGNPLLENLEGLAKVASVGSWLIIDNNSSLTNLQGLTSLESVQGRVWILNNEALQTLEGLSNLSTIGMALWVENNASLMNLNGLASLSQVEEIILLQNPALLNIDALMMVSTIDGYIVLDGNNTLQNIDGFSNITSVGYSVIVQNNNSLTNLDGFCSLISIGEDLIIRDNPALSLCCCIVQLLCSDPLDCDNDGVEGIININNNGSTCNFADILEDCLLSRIQDLDENLSRLSVYPNPTNGNFIINLENFNTKPALIKIYNHLGQNIWKRYITNIHKNDRISVNLRNAPAVKMGVYFIRVSQGSEVLSQKIIVQ